MKRRFNFKKALYHGLLVLSMANMIAPIIVFSSEGFIPLWVGGCVLLWFVVGLFAWSESNK